MVSFWPFGREDANSPRSFEKALASLSDKIQRLQTRDDTLRATHRRVKVLFTLYGSFAYILVFLILTLVTGYEKWRRREWTAVAGSPVAIFAIRYLFDMYFDWREGSVRTRLERAIQERDKVVKKLKDAMRYDSTKELLDKYAGSVKKEPKQQDASRKAASKQQQIQRTGVAPPPTANIPGRVPPAQNAIDAKLRSISESQRLRPKPDLGIQPSESFAPNAFDEPAQQRVQAQPQRSGFLDRMLDMIVGEDESAARNRIVLLCTSCRMVNGQAPPGTRSLADLGRWRCGSCGAWNGIESEVSKILEGGQSRNTTAPNSPADPSASFKRDSLDEDREGLETRDDIEDVSRPSTAATTRSRNRLSQA